MATVADLSGNRPNNAPMVDVSYEKPTRSMAGTPVGVLVPLFVGEVINDTTNFQEWAANGPLNTNWVPVFEDI